MVTVNEAIAALQKMVKADSKVGDMPLIYASDDEGNSYHRVNCAPSLAKVEDMEQHYLEMEGIYSNNPNMTEVVYEECNCVIIN